MEVKAKNGPGTPSETLELAGLAARLMAMIIDGFLVGMLLLLAFLVLGFVGGALASIAQTLTLAIPVAYHWYFWTRRDGQTPGKFVLRIRVVKADGTAISDTDAVIRAIGYQVSSIFCGLGFIWAIIDKNNQSWHDKLARTYVVNKDRQPHTVDV